MPDAIFQTEKRTAALALRNESVDVFAHGDWTRVAAPGYTDSPNNGPENTFSEPNEGWLAGANALGHWSSGMRRRVRLHPGRCRTARRWPASPCPRGSQGALAKRARLAVGLNGTTLSYDPSAGWMVQPAPPRAHHINLLSVAFAGPSSAFAVGQFGVILHWDGTAWSEDPQSISAHQLSAERGRVRAVGEGWAVGANGTILHYDGRSWSTEQPPAQDSGVNITSVTVAGSKSSRSQAAT